MPRDEKPRVERRYRRKATAIMPYAANPTARRIALAFLAMSNDLESRRYMERKSSYQDNEYTSLDHHRRLDMDDQVFKFTFRTSKTKFDRLVQLLRFDPAFDTGSRKPQAPVALQMAVTLARLAHGTKVKKLAQDFSLSGE